jgi:hypothetical protein
VIDAKLVKFTHKDGHVICKTPLSKDGVEKEARLLAERGFSLMDERGKHWLWNQCYDVLVDTKTLNLIVFPPVWSHTSADVAVSSMSKRRGQSYIGNRDAEVDLVHKGTNSGQDRDDIPVTAGSRRHRALRGAGDGQSRANEAGPSSLPALLPAVDEEEEL